MPPGQSKFFVFLGLNIHRTAGMTEQYNRIRILDRCFRDKSRVYGWKEIAKACAEDQAVTHGEYKEVSRRTIMADIALMRSGKLGFTAPIEYNPKEGYHYGIEKFSIYQNKLSSYQMKMFHNAFSVLKQLTNNEKLFSLNKSLNILEQSLNMQLGDDFQPAIYFEHSLNEPGQRWLDTALEYILNKKTMKLLYKAFADDETLHFFSPVFIKEYNNRWYVYGFDHDREMVVNLALDRVQEIDPSIQHYITPEGFDHDTWFEHLYGVTKPAGEKPVLIGFKTTKLLSAYMDTKPIHKTQQKIRETDDFAEYTLHVYNNYEIRSKLMSFGADLEVLYPESVRKEVHKL
jgi:predicted DNA-binding transcriptional regulator YafY